MEPDDPVVRRSRSVLLRLLALVEARRADRLHRALARAADDGDAERAARLLLKASRDVSSGTGRLRGRSVRRPLPRIAVLARAQFTDDARVIARQLGQERVLLIRREALKALAARLLPADVGDLTYRTSFEAEPGRMLKYRAFLTDLWRALDPDGSVQLVLTANTCYWAEVELGAALGHHGSALVALHKENLKSPGHEVRWEPIYRSQRAAFLGRRVLVQNSGERALQVRGGVAEAERIEVVGFARLDEFHAHRRATAGRPVRGDVLFASFLPGTIMPRPHGYVGRAPLLGLPVPEPEARPEDLVEACVALHRVAVAVARRLPGRRIVVKTKGLAADRYWVGRIIDHVAGPDGPPANLTIVHAGDAARMTREAGVVVGLNTTVLLEAIAAGRPTVSLALGEAATEASEFVIDLDGAADVVRREDEAVETVVRRASETSSVPDGLAPDVEDVLRRWTDNVDGTSTERTVAALRRILDGRQPVTTQLSTTRPSTRAAKRPE